MFELHKLTKIHDANSAGFDRYTYGVVTDSIAEITSDGYFPMSVFAGELQNLIIVDVVCQNGTFTLKVNVDTAKVGKTNGLNQLVIHSGDQLAGELSSNAQYVLDGFIDVSGIEITVPENGLNITSYGNSIGGLFSTTENYSMFVSPVSGSGNLFLTNLNLTASGTNSQVFDLDDATGFNAVEMTGVNFSNCSSAGELRGYRQYLEENTGRFGGKPELTFTGAMNGARITTSIVRGISLDTALFIAGPALTMGGRFITDINCDLPATGALFDFSESNITNDESLILNGCTITRNGVQSPNDTTIHPNIDQKSVKSLWRDNVGIRNTIKYVKSRITATSPTTLTVDNYAPLVATWSQVSSSHIEMSSNGVWRRLTGAGELRFTGDILVSGINGDEIDIRAVVSEDNGVNFTREIEHIKRDINNFAGSSDIAFFPINFIGILDKGEFVRIEVENKTASNSVTAIVDSYLDISQV